MGFAKIFDYFQISNIISDEEAIIMNEKIKCPIPVDGRECGREEILDRKRPIGKLPGSSEFIVHHECSLHKFHIVFPGGKWKPCDCK